MMLRLASQMLAEVFSFFTTFTKISIIMYPSVKTSRNDINDMNSTTRNILAMAGLTLICYSNSSLANERDSSLNNFSIVNPEVRNRITVTEQHIILEHPNYQISFSAAGVIIDPTRGPQWRWQTHTVSLGQPAQHTIQPHRSADNQIDFWRGAVTERYIIRRDSIDQQFVIPTKPTQLDREFVIQANIDSSGQGRFAENGYAWRDALGEVQIAALTARGADGRELNIRMQLSEAGTTIKLDTDQLAEAKFPVIID